MDNIDNNNINNVDIYENDIDLYLHEFMEVNNIPDLRAASQSVWNACLMYLRVLITFCGVSTAVLARKYGVFS